MAEVIGSPSQIVDQSAVPNCRLLDKKRRTSQAGHTSAWLKALVAQSTQNKSGVGIERPPRTQTCDRSEGRGGEGGVRNVHNGGRAASEFPRQDKTCAQKHLREQVVATAFDVTGRRQVSRLHLRARARR